MFLAETPGLFTLHFPLLTQPETLRNVHQCAVHDMLQRITVIANETLESHTKVEEDKIRKRNSQETLTRQTIIFYELIDMLGNTLYSS